MRRVDPHDYPIDVEAHRRSDLSWLDELDRIAVHAGEPHQRMGTRAVDETDWLRVDELRSIEIPLRRRLVAEASDEVHLALAGSEEACADTADTVRAWLGSHHASALAEWGDQVHQPLVRAALCIQEDLCVMERDDEGWRLTAGLLCFPTYWRLADKLGRPQEAIHDPVPHFRQDLAEKVTRFFDRLPPGRIIGRRNWGFSAHPLLFVPDLSVLQQPSEFHPDHLWLRSERQTLRRLPLSGAIVFTIRVQLAPALALTRRPRLAERLLGAIESWSPELVESRGGRHGWVPDVTSWLRTVVAEG